MALLSSRCCWATNGCFFRTGVSYIWRPDGARLISQAKYYSIPGGKRQTFAVECMAAKNSKKRFIKPKKGVALESDENQSIELQDNGSSSEGLLSQNSSVEETPLSASVSVPSRGAVLQACSVTSGLLAAIGIIIRQVSHAAFMEGLPVNDCTTQVSFGFEMWHLELITGLVVLISSSRYALLKTWPDFAESSQAANQQVLTSLEPVDYLVVAFLPGISEELLFRGAMIPALGLNWASVLVVATIFGALHLGSGRKYSFAVWATFVGLAYGYATIVTGSVVVPVVSHALNNLVGGLLWRYDPKLSK